MAAQAAYSTAKTAADAIADIRRQTGEATPRMVLYFASSNYDQDALAAGMRAAFADATVFGCSTSGELVSGAVLKGSVVCMALDAETVDDVCVQTVEVDSDESMRAAADAFAAHFGTPLDRLDVERHIGLVLSDGLSGAEERFMDRLGNLSNILFLGGSAGDDLKFKQTWVHRDGRAHPGTVLLAVVKPAKGFDFVKAQSFCSRGKTLVATEVDEATRRVMRFDGKPAAQAYIEASGAPPELLEAPLAEASAFFADHPLGLIIDGDPYVRAPQSFDGSDMNFWCNIKEGMELQLLESTNILADTRKAVDEVVARHGSVAAIVDFHCLFRALELERAGHSQQYGQIFSDIPMIGFATYGEQFIGHVNQTSTMLVLL